MNIKLRLHVELLENVVKNLLELSDEEIKKANKNVSQEFVLTLKNDQNNIIVSILKSLQEDVKCLQNDLNILQEENKNFRKGFVEQDDIEKKIELEREIYDNI